MDVSDARFFAYTLLAGIVALVGAVTLGVNLSGAAAFALFPAAILVLAALVFLDGYLS